jgi:hypothetical protein
MEQISILVLVLGGITGWVLGHRFKDYYISLDEKIDDKLDEIPKLFEHARKCIKIATDFDKRFFDYPEVKRSIEAALLRGVKVRILCEGDPPEWYRREGIEIKRVQKLPHHMMVIDERHARVESPHEPLKFGERSALVFKDFPGIASYYTAITFFS